jgi:hypothetical protein
MDLVVWPDKTLDHYSMRPPELSSCLVTTDYAERLVAAQN